MNGRGVLALGVLAAWGAGAAAYTRRELSRSPMDKLAEVAMRVSPGASYFAVERGGAHVGFASNTLDTVPQGLQVTDYFVADVADNGRPRRASGKSVVHLSRALALRDFAITYGTDSLPVTASGRTIGDSILAYVVGRSGLAGDTIRVRLHGPLLLPTLVPLAVALGKTPTLGAQYTIDTFDPATLSIQALHLSIAADSMLVVTDSAAFDPGSARWSPAHAERVRAWHLVARDGGDFDTWVDELGRIVAVRARSGFTLRRTAYELAFENWRTASSIAPRRTDSTDARRRPSPGASAEAVGHSPGGSILDTLRLRIRGLAGPSLQLNGGYQKVSGDTITTVRDQSLTLRPSFPLPPSAVVRRRFSAELRAEPLLGVDHPAIVSLAKRLKGTDSQADVVVRRIAQWVHDSLASEASSALPSAVATLRSGRGGNHERTLLFAALARAAGVPTRLVSGMVYLDGAPSYLAWAEVLLQRWVPVDPTDGQFPADASHIRLVVGTLRLQTELRRIIDRTSVVVLHQARHPLPNAMPAANRTRK